MAKPKTAKPKAKVETPEPCLVGDVPMLGEASVILYQDFFVRGLHLLLARVDHNEGGGWALYKQSGFSANRMKLLNGATFSEAVAAYQSGCLLREAQNLKKEVVENALNKIRPTKKTAGKRPQSAFKKKPKSTAPTTESQEV